MKRQPSKKWPASSRKNTGRKKGGSETPPEFERGWQELEDQYNRMQSDWTSLAAMMGINSKDE
ncbi:MAG: hypothetical protein HY921_08760 [Elusimicrobia bacterium]|nr:hypothetical protein [Elusimicrobiota bacterium]